MHTVVFGLFCFKEEGKLHLECAFLSFCACVGLWFIEECVVLRLCWYIVYRTRNVWLCACVGLWFIERGILHLECAFLGFCACVGLCTRNITFGVRLSWFLRLCWFMVYRTTNITVGVRLSCRADRTNRTNRIALCLDVITRCTLRIETS